MDASIPDLLRLLALPIFGWAAWRDVKTRRVPNRTWLPLAGLGGLLLVWEGVAALTATPTDVGFFVQVAISLGFILPLTTVFWWMGSFGGADAKAFYVIALLFPAYPLYSLGLVDLPGLAPMVLQFPLEAPRFGVFSLAILSNTVVVGLAYPLAVALGNLVRRNVGLPMVIGKPVAWEAITEEYGLLLETPEGYTRRGLDLDALRMYLQWRGCSLADLRADAATYRDPATVPDQPYAPGDGSIAPDGGEERDDPPAADGDPDRDDDPAPAEGTTGADETAPAEADDPWGAERFLDDLDGSAYGTTPEGLRQGLDVLVERDEVWISPGIPFLVPTFVGLLVALVYGDLLFSALVAVGLL